MSATTGRDDDRDAWLAEALRHAPDAAEAPPPMLRDAILAEARAAALGRAAPTTSGASAAGPRAPRRPAFVDRAAGWWAALARPPVAAGFATVMVAVLVGVMWHDRPLDEAMPTPPPLRDEAPSPAPAPTPAPVTAPTESAPPLATPTRKTESRRLTEPGADSHRQATGAATGPTPAMSPPVPTAVPTPEARRREPAADAFPASPASLAKADESRTAPADAQPVARERPVTAARGREAADVPAGEALSAPAPAPTVAAANRQAESARSRDADTGRPEARSQGFPATAPSPRTAMKQRPAAAPRPMAPLLDALAAVDARWTRVGVDGAVVAIDSSFADWLASVDAAVAGRWQPGSPPSPDRGKAPSIELRRDGSPVATLRIDDDAIVFRDAAGSDWFATLAPGSAALLRAAAPPPRRSGGR